MKVTFLFLVWLFFIGISQAQVNIKGEWISLNPEKTASGYYGVREFTRKSKTWEVRYTHYVDSLLQNPIFTFKGGDITKLTGFPHLAQNKRSIV